ncbi:hypothetical protein Q5424_26285 [Conexibacter sp. JD483]|uniref:hypothetical protein n=1 Tax=unclassified Conexibacter TaxID=2627773 RepID=UPI0027222975|nr:MULTISPECIES: hypothetical protein [unclassified Conexibacter]MDO8189471.1 hypothetical protein [Conexibacter sp. CPCC 205706]MDO8202061.1 hypothetical protein [Conexibacter sp. CPCC 205762]MDR9372636.1 hypothetical protein [Conexibacter sp. JD483]
MPIVPLAAAALAAAGGGTAPLYPGNTLAIARPPRLVAASVQKVRLSGRATWDEPTSATTTGYTVSLYVQNAAVDDRCEPSYGAQLQKSINLPGLNASTSISGFVMSDAFRLEPEPPSSTLDWSGESVPFAVKLGVPAIVLCAYQRYITDDVAWYQLPLRPQAPSCTFASRSARRGARVAVRCNVSGPIGFRFTRAGARGRTLRATANRDGRARLKLSGLAAGGWRVAIASNGVALGRRTLKLR